MLNFRWKRSNKSLHFSCQLLKRG